MATSNQDIYDTLTGSATPPKKGPCGCPGASSGSASDVLTTELESALEALGKDSSGLDLFNLDETSLGDSFFADVAQEPTITLQDIVSLAEQYPGLKITISF